MRSMLFAFSFFAAAAIPVVSFGQMNNTGGRSGSSMGSTSGSSGFGSSMGSSGFGSGSSFGSAGFGTFGSGSSSATGNGFGAMGNGGGMGMGQQGMGMGGNQQGGNFLGVNANQFLGSSAGGQNQQGGRNGMNGMNGMGMNGMNGGNRAGGNRGGLNTMNSMMNGMNSGANNRQQPMVRPRQKVAFDYPAPKVEEIHTNMNTQLQRIAIKNPGLSNVMLTSEGPGQMVLRGVVKSEADAKLAANLVRLEPGVRSVRSELTFPPENAPAE